MVVIKACFLRKKHILTLDGDESGNLAQTPHKKYKVKQKSEKKQEPILEIYHDKNNKFGRPLEKQLMDDQVN